MSARIDPATGTVTGLIPDHPPGCEFCKDDLPQSPRTCFDGEHYACDDRAACYGRQARREAEKNREPRPVVPEAARVGRAPEGYQPLPEGVPLTKEVLRDHIEGMGGTFGPAEVTP